VGPEAWRGPRAAAAGAERAPARAGERRLGHVRGSARALARGPGAQLGHGQGRGGRGAEVGRGEWVGRSGLEGERGHGPAERGGGSS
jgi:hypothetical protein